MTTLPPVNVQDSAQNAWVQDWLTAYQQRTAPAEVTVESVLDADAFERVIECVQETYNYQDHQGATS